MSDHAPDVDWDTVYVLPSQEVSLIDFPSDEEWILDIGGGGEGIIGKMKGRQVVAIDRVGAELQETTNDSLKLVMDARQLNFLENSFGTATLFFTLMYVPFEDVSSIFSELSRVLKPGGELLIWDATVDVPPEYADKELFMIPLTINFPDGTSRQTAYGASIRNQDVDLFLGAAQELGFEVVEQHTSGLTFFVRLALRKG